MNVICPACNAQHRVSDQMAGKRGKCSCGEIMTIPAAPVPQPAAAERANNFFVQPVAATAPLAPRDSTSGLSSPTNHEQILFECRYGMVRSFMWWLMGANLIIALVLIPAGIFWNKGWTISHAPLPPVAATILFECVGFGMLLLIAYMVGGHFLHRKKPQRVAVTAAGVMLPKGKLSTEELFIPWSQVRVKHRGGRVAQLDFKRGFLRDYRLVSIQFPTDDDFEAFLECLREHDKL